MDFLIKEGEVSDMPTVLELIKELAKITGKDVKIDVYDLIKDGFSLNPLFKVFVAEIKREIVGFAIFYRAYSTNGKSMILEDIFVSKKYKNFGIGLSLFAKFLNVARKNGMKRLEWTLLDKHKNLLKLYQKSGGKILWDTDVYSMDEHDIKKALKHKSTKSKKNPFKQVIIRKGEKEDMKDVIKLIIEASIYKKTSCDIDIFDLLKDGFSEDAYFSTYVLEVDKKVVGMLLYYTTYSTFKGKGVIIEELFITEKYRRYGFGQELNYKLLEYVQKNNMKRISQAIYNFDDETIDRSKYVGATVVKGLKIIQIGHKALDKFINK